MTHRAATIAVSAALLAATPLLGGCIVINASYNEQDRHEETRIMRIPAPDAVSVDLATYYGDIDIGPIGAPLPHWAVEHAPLDADFTAAPGEALIIAVVGSRDAARVAEAVVAPVLDGHRLTVDARFPGGHHKGDADGVRYAIRAAGFTDTDLTSGFGDIRVAHATGHADINTDFGDVELHHHAGSAKVYSDFGDITVHPAPGHRAPFSLETDYGAIEGEGFDVPVRAHSDYGDIVLRGVGGPIDAFTDFGLVDLALTDDNPGSLRAESDFGDVVLELGPGFRGRLTADADGGDVRLKRFDDPSVVLDHNDDRAVLQFGDASTNSHAETGFGGVFITRRDASH